MEPCALAEGVVEGVVLVASTAAADTTFRRKPTTSPDPAKRHSCAQVCRTSNLLRVFFRRVTAPPS